MDSTEMRQVKMAKAFHLELKNIAKARSIYLREVYDEAIRWFVKYRSKFGTYDQYLTSPREGAYKSMWLTRSIVAQVKTVSMDDGVSENRVIYTSLYLYAQQLDDGKSSATSLIGTQNTVDAVR
ncbi:MAG: hypothetical protein K0U93_23115 [Gammaproteobacteria bacterium]|nr:hypothetical protein [Gammaproteobacteria bacterium]